jgi:hypothetical protein
MTPAIAFVGFYFLGYFLIIASSLALIFSWRFIFQLKEENHSNERVILGYAFLLALIEALLFSSDQVIWMVFIQFAGLLLAHMYKQFVTVSTSSVDRHESKLEKAKGPFAILGLFVLASGFVYFIFDYVFMAFSFILALLKQALAWLLTIIIKFVAWTGLDITPIENLVKSLTSEGLTLFGNKDSEEIKYQRSQEGDTTWAEENLDTVFNITFWIVLSIVIITLIIVAIILYRRRIVVQTTSSDGSIIMHTKQDVDNRSGRNKLFGIFAKKPTDPVRHLFYDFEQFAYKRGFGRKSFETIEEWFRRVEFPVADVLLYRKVRYGEELLTKEEIDTFKQEISVLKNFISKQEKARKKED